MTAGAGPLLVLGASGRLGRLLRAGWPDGNAVWHARQRQDGFTAFDVLGDPGALVQAAKGARAILCLSGLTPAHAARHGGAMSVNVDLALAAIRGAAAAGVPRVFLASSAAVYGRGQGVLHEDAACAPVTDYGRAKLAMEAAGLALGRELGVAVTCLRIGNVAGADAILAGWQPGMRLDALEDGTTPRRSYIGPGRLSRTLHRLSLAGDLPDTINIAAPGTVAIGRLLDAAGLAWQRRPAGAEVIAEVALATGRLTRHVTFDAADSTPEGLVADWMALGGNGNTCG